MSKPLKYPVMVGTRLSVEEATRLDAVVEKTGWPRSIVLRTLVRLAKLENFTARAPMSDEGTTAEVN